jgi:transcriptional regulator of acetoin/glycerol metabolism
MQKFKSYSWPGNIRELRNAMEFAIMLNSGEDIIALKDLPGQLRMSLLYRDTPEIIQPAVDPLVQERQGIENSEKALYAKAIRVSDGNLSEAAKILNVGRSTLYRKIRKFGLRV